jgi:hypothetical protein
MADLRKYDSPGLATKGGLSTKFARFSSMAAILLAGLALAACSSGSLTSSSTSTSTSSTSTSSPSASTSTSGTVSPTSLAPSTSTTADVSYGQQFLTDVAPWNAATANLNASDGLTSQAVITAGNEAVVAARSLLGQSWPPSAQADVHTFAVGLDTINEDVREDDSTKFRDDVTTLDADANVVRADLGLPSIK